MTSTLPKQYCNPNLRFIRLNKPNGTTQDKAPLPGFSWAKSLLKYDSPILTDHRKQGRNFGIAGGHGNLVLIESDCKEIDKIIKEQLPLTWRVKSGSLKPGGCHNYFIVKDCEKLPNCSFIVPGVTFDSGSMRIHNQYVVAEGSKHPSGNPYKAENNEPIAEVSAELILKVLKPYIKKKDLTKGRKEKRKEKKALMKLKNNNLPQLNVSDIIKLSSLTERDNGEYSGSHPLKSHGSTTGMNFWVNPSSNEWSCFRHGHDSGGSWAELIAVMEGIIDCSEAGSECLKGDKFIKVLKIAQEKYGLKKLENQTMPDNNTIPLAKKEEEEQFNMILPKGHFIRDYCDYAGQLTDAYPEYHFQEALNLLSLSSANQARILTTPESKKLNLYQQKTGLKLGQ